MLLLFIFLLLFFLIISNIETDTYYSEVDDWQNRQVWNQDDFLTEGEGWEDVNEQKQLKQ